jgi:DnaA family protein
MSSVFQYPFDFVIRKELLFSNFVCMADNAPLVHFLRQFMQARERLCFLHGVRGSGKTHLLQALCQHSEHGVYLPLAQLLPYGPATLDDLEQLDLLVLDDVQVIAGNPEWEHKLFELFNAVHAGQGHLCLAADEAPGRLPLQLADLRSRLQLCVPFEVQELDDQHKTEVLRLNAEQRGMELRDDAAQFILLHSSRNLHDLMALLDRLDRLSLAQQRRITIPFMKACLGW